MRLRPRILLMVLLISLINISAMAQHGGKAEPNHIQFAKGKSSATLKDNIKGSEESEYSFTANKDQTVHIVVKSVPADNIEIVLQDPNNQPVALLASDKNSYSLKLPDNGDYFLSFHNRNQKRSKTSFTFTISIK